MKRIAINFVALLLLFIAIFALIAWPASYQSIYAAIRMTAAGPAVRASPREWPSVTPYWITVVTVYNGRFRLVRSRHVTLADEGYGWHALRIKPSATRAGESKARALWFHFEYQPGTAEEYSYVLGIPLWFVIIAVGAFPMLRLAQRRRTNRRQRSQCCPACGYDLRATPQRCPECGIVAAERTRGC